MRRILAAALFTGVTGLVVWSGVAQGGSVDTPRAAEPSAPGPGSVLDLSIIRARALGIVAEPLPAPTLGFEPQRAPTGAGSLRMPPATTSLGGGVYVGLMPGCLPGDDLGGLARRRTGSARR